MALALCTTIQIIYLRLSAVRRTRRQQAFLACWQTLMLNALVSQEIAHLPALHVNERVFFLVRWLQLQESIDADNATGLIALGYRVGCHLFARDFLSKGDRTQQLLAILALGNLRDASAWELLAKTAYAKDTLQSITAFQALVKINAQRAAEAFIVLLLERDTWPLAHVVSLLQNHKADFATPLIEQITQVRDKKLIRALHLIEALGLQLPTVTLTGLFDRDQHSEVIA